MTSATASRPLPERAARVLATTARAWGLRAAVARVRRFFFAI